ncbi:hypothetical protein J7E81_02935 [Bacillus sp. ISL-18]|uniref:DUF6241 domain-containing protein n=1 Tax=Bacillus sp. ISL-18 TaxID=2819118 RepID=UPI001BE814EA|nr:DUF6241 domain-containing protein [Bacillus sp. ISL-18]MBT2654199.1 hypothetical protein [Bacillus sp. ISL-18]
MKKFLGWIFGILAASAALTVVMIFGLNSFEGKAEADEITVMESVPTISQVREDALDEETYQKILHAMTHQKVAADEKWGGYRITEEDINLMLRTLEVTNYDHEDYYRKVLTSWKRGDFSNAVEVHNKIWEWQGGNIGKATRLLTPQEEKEYIKKNFK